MYTLEFEKRDVKSKAKQLRKSGRIPCNVFYAKKKETLLVTVASNDVAKMLQKKGKGGLVTLQGKEDSYNVVIKEIGFDGLNNQVENITFQVLEEDIMITSVARVLLRNKDKINTMIQILIPEIPYQTSAEHLVETEEIDLSKLRPGMTLQVKDLSIAKKEDIEILIDPERMVLNISLS